MTPGRSYLFTPAHQPRLLARAHTRGADVVLLDLEDSVPLPEKAAARAGLAAAVAGLVCGLVEGRTLAESARLGQCAAAIKLSSAQSVATGLSRDRLRQLAGS